MPILLESELSVRGKVRYVKEGNGKCVDSELFTVHERTIYACLVILHATGAVHLLQSGRTLAASAQVSSGFRSPEIQQIHDRFSRVKVRGRFTYQKC